uniref:uncharacterized protein LOC120341781 n=1 Tax=Styela clava TaxID=7725 RepID=UPI001939D6D4|nr:uncharacterized protein LOC120341781 [Styela clava]
MLVLVAHVHGHGRLRVPHSRSTMWRYPDDSAIKPYLDIVEENFNDNELFCGGFTYQQNLGGKCGVCGDPWDADVKENEAGGKYAKGIIVEQYTPGSWFTVTVELTAHHKGYFEFRLCPWNNVAVPITHECLDQYVLANNKGSTQWMVPTSTGGSSQYFDVTLKLPEEIECDQCVLQWKYKAGNTWNCDSDGECCSGCGPQEEFYGCADIAIGTGATFPPPGFTNSTQTAKTTTTKNPSTTTQSILTTTTTTAALTTASPIVTTDDGSTSGACPGGEPGKQYLYTCESFYICDGSNQVIYNCPPGTVFNEESSLCDYSFNSPPPCGVSS